MDSTARPPHRARWLVWLGGALVLAFALAWGALAIFFPPARVRALVQAQLSSTLAREIRFDDASIGLWPPVRLTVKGLRLAEPGGLANGSAVELASLHLDLDVLALLARRLEVRRLALDGPKLHLVLRPDGSTNLDDLAAAKPAGAKPAAAPLDLAVRELSISGGRVLIDDLKAGRRTALGVAAKLGFTMEQGGARIATAGETRLSGLAYGPLSAARLSDLNRSLAAIEWRIEHRGKFDAERKRLALERLALRFGRTELAFAGVVDDPGPRAAVDFHARGERIDLGEVLAALASADAKALRGVKGSGSLGFDLAVRGRLGTARPPTVTGTLGIANGAFRYPGAPAGVEALALTARFAPDSLGIPNLTARVAGQPVRARLEVTRFADPRVRFAVQGDVDLAAVAPLVAPRDTKLGGSAAVDVRGAGRARDPGAIELEGRAKLSNVSVESPALPRKVEKIEGEIAFSPARASVRGLTAHAGESSFTLDGTVARPLALLAKPDSVPPADVDFTLRSPHLDLAELLPTTPGTPLLPNARGGGHVEIARLKNGKLDVANVVANLVLSPAVLEVPTFGLDGYGGAVHGNARFDLHDSSRPIYAIKARVDTVEADALLSAWTPAKGLLHGALNTTLDFSGQGTTPDDLKRSLTAVGLAALANGTLGPGPSLEAIAAFTKVPSLKTLRFKDFKLPFRIERGRLVSDPVVIDGPSGEWRLAGAVGFDGSLDYAVSTTLPPEVVASLGARSALAAGALADEQGRVLIDLKVSGTAKAPRVAWDSKAMRDRLAGRASAALAEQRAKLESEAQAALESRRQAAADSARAAVERYRQAVADSLRRKAGDVFRGFFGSPKDTAAH
jgi:AsmA protein